MLTQPLVALSSGKSEFYALVRAAVEALFLRNMLRWFEDNITTPELVSDAKVRF